MADNARMDLPGHVRNGVVVFDGGAGLPEGTPVMVSRRLSVHRKPGKPKRVKLPLVDSKCPGSLSLNGEQIAQALEEEDLAALRQPRK